MSKSIPDSSINLGDSLEELHRKIIDCGKRNEAVILQMIVLASNWSPDKLIKAKSAFVQPNTLLEKLYDEGKFTPPKLWSIIAVIKRTAQLGSVRIGHFNDTPPPIAIPHNYKPGNEKTACPLCNEKVMHAIDEYRLTHDIQVFDGLTCSCQND